MNVRRALAAAMAAAMFAVAPPASAAKVGLVAEDARDPFVAKLALELAQLGFEVVPRAGAASSDDEIATLRVSRADLELDVGGRKTPLAFARKDALKAAEQVHAVLLPLVEKAQASAEPVVEAAPAETRDAPVAHEAPPTSTRPLEISAGLGALFGGLDPGMSASAAATWMIPALRAGRLAFGASFGGVIGLVPEGVSGTQGSASLRAFMFGPQLVGQLALGGAAFAELGVGAWLHHVRVSGDARAPFPSRDDAAWSWGPVARARLRYDLGDAVGLYVEPMGGVSMPGVAVRFAGDEVATWGRPWGSVGAGIRVAF